MKFSMICILVLCSGCSYMNGILGLQTGEEEVIEVGVKKDKAAQEGKSFFSIF